MDNETNSSSIDTPQIPSTFSVSAAIKPVAQSPRNNRRNNTVATPVKAKTTSVGNTLPSNVQKLQNLIQKFESEYIKEDKNTIQYWISICDFLNKTNDPKVYQNFYVWFATHDGTNLKNVPYSESASALYGIQTIQNLKVKTMISSVHQCYQELARVLRSGKGHFRFTSRAMQILGISEPLARWFLSYSER